MGWIALHGRVVHVDVYGEVMLCNLIANESVLNAEAVKCMSSAESVWNVGVSLCC